ncbi:MAG: Holliday junction branch migration protein RuvA [Nitrospirota bacterium]
MIAALTGTLAEKLPNRLTISVQGVGYDVTVPLSTFYQLPDVGTSLSLFVHTHVREDAIQLFGFLSRPEKECFLLLLSVNGVGPKVAMGLLSGLSVADLAGAIRRGDEARLSAVPGIGPKTAARLVLELKDKVLPFVETEGQADGNGHDDHLQRDVVSALTNLGYSRHDARDVVRKVWRESAAERSVERLLKESLKVLSK